MISSQPFAEFRVDVTDIIDLEPHAIGHRRLVPITGGTVSGELGSGVILPGSDWQWVQADGNITLDAHYALQLDSGERIEVESRGLRNTSPDGETYFRTVIRLTTAADRPEVNRRLFISVGTRLKNQVLLTLYALT